MTLGAALSAAATFIMSADVTGLVKIGALVGSAVFTAYVSYKMYSKKKEEKEKAEASEDAMKDYMEFSVANENANTVDETIKQVRNTISKADKKRAKKESKNNRKARNDKSAELRLELARFNEQLGDIQNEVKSKKKKRVEFIDPGFTYL